MKKSKIFLIILALCAFSVKAAHAEFEGIISGSKAVSPSVTIVAYVNGTITVTWANVNTPQIASLTLAGATCTVAMTGGGTGSVHRLFVNQDTIGTRTAVFATATVYLPGGQDIVWSSSPNARDIVSFICLDGVHYYLTSFAPDVKSK